MEVTGKNLVDHSYTPVEKLKQRLEKPSFFIWATVNESIWTSGSGCWGWVVRLAFLQEVRKLGTKNLPDAKIKQWAQNKGTQLCQPICKSIGQIGNLTQIQGEKKKLWDSSCPTHDGSQGRINNDLNYPSMLPFAGNFNWFSCSIHPLPVCFHSLKKNLQSVKSQNNSAVFGVGTYQGTG